MSVFSRGWKTLVKIALSPIIALNTMVSKYLLDWMKPDIKKPNLKPVAFEDVNIPSIEVGRPIPVIFGTCVIKGPSVVWYGDYRAEKKEKDSIMFFKYYMGLHLIMCHGPVDEFVGMFYETINLAPVEGPVGTFKINKEYAFGGHERDGGIVGDIAFYKGTETETPDLYLTNKIVGLENYDFFPAFRGACSLVFKHVYIGQSPNLKVFEYILKRRSNTTGFLNQAHGLMADGYGANPVHILAEVITNDVWGRGLPWSIIDIDSFNDAALTVYAEKIGVSLVWNNTDTIDSFMSTILQYIHGVIFQDARSGKFKIKLIREDYDPGSIRVINESDIIELSQLARASQKDLINTLTVKYTDRKSKQQAVVTAQNIALIYTQDAPLSETIDFSGITDPTTAAMVAERELNIMSRPVATGTATVTFRAGYALTPGEPVRLKHSMYDVDMIVRIVSIEYGTTSTAGVVIGFTEDVFAHVKANINPGETKWEDPMTIEPLPIISAKLQNAPYWFVSFLGGSTEIVNTSPGADYPMIAVENNQQVSGSVQHYWNSVDNKNTAEYAGMSVYAGAASLEMDINQTETVIAYKFGNNFNTTTIKKNDVIQINAELMRVDTVGAVALIVGRGCFDTVPEEHGANSKIFLLTSNNEPNCQLLPVKLNQSSYVWPLPVLPAGILDIADATGWGLGKTVAGRAISPLPPGNIRINGARYPATVSGNTIIIQWSIRNRLAEVGYPIIDTLSGDDVAGDGPLSVVGEVYNDNDVLVDSGTAGMNDKTLTLNISSVAASTGLRVIVYSVRTSDSIRSLYSQYNKCQKV